MSWLYVRKGLSLSFSSFKRSHCKLPSPVPEPQTANFSPN